MLVEERAAKELVRRQQLEQWRARQRRVVDITMKQGPGDSLAVANLLADHDIGVIALGALVQSLEGLVTDPVVVVDEVDILARRSIDAHVARAARPS